MIEFFKKNLGAKWQKFTTKNNHWVKQFGIGNLLWDEHKCFLRTNT
jgi:hypothetical protein